MIFSEMMILGKYFKHPFYIRTYVCMYGVYVLWVDQRATLGVASYYLLCFEAWSLLFL